jgi:hypothetical protein
MAARGELEHVEIELSAILERARNNESSRTQSLRNKHPQLQDPFDPSRNPSSNIESEINTYNSKKIVSNEHLSNLVVAVMNDEDTDISDNVLATALGRAEGRGMAYISVALRCEFSLHEVLSGYARVTRLNGEEPKSYRTRLEKRLSALLILDQQLQEELLDKTKDVRRARDQLREAEVLRLRVELQVANVESNIRQLLIENPPPPPQTMRPTNSNLVDMAMTMTNISPTGSPSHHPHLLETAIPSAQLQDFQNSSLPGSMYSPKVSLSPTTQNYLLSVAQLSAHGGDSELDQVSALRLSLKTLENEALTPEPKGYNTDLFSPPHQAPRVPQIETYDGKSGRRLFSPPTLMAKNKPVRDDNYLDGHGDKASSRKALERARGSIQKLSAKHLGKGVKEERGGEEDEIGGEDRGGREEGGEGGREEFIGYDESMGYRESKGYKQYDSEGNELGLKLQLALG